METITQRTTTSVGQAGVHKPAGAAASVFEAGKMAKAQRATAVLNPLAVTIKKGVPLPPSQAPGRGIDRYAALLDRMGEGDCVELLPGQANALAAKAKKLGISVAKRRVSETHIGVWRLASKG